MSKQSILDEMLDAMDVDRTDMSAEQDAASSLMWNTIDNMIRRIVDEKSDELGLLTPADVQRIAEDYLEAQLAISPKSLRSLNKIIEMMDDLDNWDFMELMRIFDTKLDSIIFYEHEQDDFRHLNEEDRMAIAMVGDLYEAVLEFAQIVGEQLSQLRRNLDAMIADLLALREDFIEHIGNTDIHFVEDEKEIIFQGVMNWSNDLFMRPARITTVITDRPDGSTEISSVARRMETDTLGNDVSFEFAWKSTIITDENIVTSTQIDLDGRTASAVSTVTITDDEIVKVIT